MLKFTDNILDDFTPSAIMTNNSFGILANNPDKDGMLTLLYSFDWEDFSAFTRLGVSADFLTKLGQYKIVSGDYGIKFLFYSSNGTEERVSERDFSVNDMVGNPYQFEVATKQEKLFDISKLENVKKVEIYLYQANNFYDEFYERIPYKTEKDEIANVAEELFQNNILIQNLKIYLGYSFSEFDGDLIQISTTGRWSYSKQDSMSNQERYLNLRWVHQLNDNTYVIYTNEDVKKEDIHIHWFRYTLNQANKEYEEAAGGRNWSKNKIAQEYKKDSFQSYFTPDRNKAQERIMVSCEYKDEYGEKRYVRKEVVFENELAIVDESTYNAATQLTIHCLDDSEGNYFIYNPSSKIINEGHGQGYPRMFEARYQGIPLKDIGKDFKDKITEIRWILPQDSNNKSTMLTYGENYFDGASVVKYIDEENDTLADTISVTRTLDQINGFNDFRQLYSIKNNWHSSNSSNIIRCEVMADDILYKASLDLQFGKAGTSGTNITLVLEFDNNENALSLDSDGVIVKPVLYDMSGAKIAIPDKGWEWSWLHNNENKESPEFIPFIDIQSEGPRVKLTFNENFDIMQLEKNYHILVAKLSGIAATPIIAYLPIPIKQNSVNYMEGAREVIYNSQGIPSYYTDAYLLSGDGDYTEVNWGISENKKVELKDLEKDGIVYKGLSVSNSVYVSGDDKVCIYAFIEHPDESKTIFWSQPILVMQSQYDYAIINDWNGKTTLTNGNSVISAMLGAGRKNNNNIFSGILIGNIQPEDSSTQETDDGVNEMTNTGLYGISNGIVTFSLTDSGIATFGSRNEEGVATTGQIVLGADSNTIMSTNGNYNVDIDNGKTNITHDEGITNLTIGGDPQGNYLSLSNGENNILQFNKDNYLIQSLSGKLKIKLNGDNEECFTSGNLTISNQGDLLINNTLNISSLGTLALGDLRIADSGALTIGALNIAESGAIEMGKFKVDADGNITYNNKSLEDYIKSFITT